MTNTINKVMTSTDTMFSSMMPPSPAPMPTSATTTYSTNPSSTPHVNTGPPKRSTRTQNPCKNVPDEACANCILLACRQMLANSKVFRQIESRATNPTYRFTNVTEAFSLGEMAAPFIVFGDMSTVTVKKKFVEYFFGKCQPLLYIDVRLERVGSKME